MHHRDLLARTCRMRIARFAEPGAYLVPEGEPQGPEVLLPNNEVTRDVSAGDVFDAFVHLDSEDRPVATRRPPKLELGEVAFLEVTDVSRIGAFVDWGFPKHLLVPFAEQTRELRVGERHPIGLYIDDSGRLAGTMRVTEMLAVGEAEFEVDEWVPGEAWRKEPTIGVFVILERAHVGLVPKSEPTSLARGEAARFRVTQVLPDGKIELSLRGHAHEEVGADAERILEKLAKGDARGPLRVSDHSSPSEIRALFGMSKKAFKRAAGRLLREGKVRVADDGTFAVALRR